MLRHRRRIFKEGEKIKEVIFCYAKWQDQYEKLKEEKVVTKWIDHMPTNDEFDELTAPFKDKGGSIVVIDDFMSKVGPDVDEIVRVTGRHNNATVMVLFQSLFPPHKLARQISLNIKYFHLHKNPRENHQIHTLATQLRPGNGGWIVKAYQHATQEQYSSLLIDLTQECPEYLRFRSHYLPHEKSPMITYQSEEDEVLDPRQVGVYY
jgi:Cft2 family RNA processing exonuclease